MSDLTITIPLSMLGNAENLTAQGILDAFQGTADQKAAIAKLTNDIQQAGQYLTNILEDSPNELEKAKALRGLATDMTNYGKTGLTK